MGKEGLSYFEIRIRIHTGPVVAGILGVKKFQYDIWGDTVNTAPLNCMKVSSDSAVAIPSNSSYFCLADFALSVIRQCLQPCAPPVH